MNILNLISFCQFIFKIWSKNQILTWIKGHNSVANLQKNNYLQLVLKKNQILTSIKGRNSVANVRKTQIYNTNVDLVNDNVYTKFGLNLSIHSQDIEQKPNKFWGQSRAITLLQIYEKQWFTLPM